MQRHQNSSLNPRKHTKYSLGIDLGQDMTNWVWPLFTPSFRFYKPVNDALVLNATRSKTANTDSSHLMLMLVSKIALRFVSPTLREKLRGLSSKAEPPKPPAIFDWNCLVIGEVVSLSYQ